MPCVGHITSLSGPVESLDGKLMLRIPRLRLVAESWSRAHEASAR
jgi:hypothetical protein